MCIVIFIIIKITIQQNCFLGWGKGVKGQTYKLATKKGFIISFIFSAALSSLIAWFTTFFFLSVEAEERIS